MVDLGLNKLIQESPSGRENLELMSFDLQAESHVLVLIEGTKHLTGEDGRAQMQHLKSQLPKCTLCLCLA